MQDMAEGRVADLERLLQVLAVLRANELGVSRTELIERVGAYAVDAANPTTAVDSLKKKMQLDVDSLRGLGFDIRDQVRPGQELPFVMRLTPWRAPLDLDD